MDIQHWQQSSYEPYLPVTEKSNPITRDIDRANPREIVQMLQKCDAEIFEKTSYGNPMYQTLNSLSVVQTLVDVTKRVEVILKDPEDSLIVLSGCGTSGRFAFHLATSLNRLLASQNRKPIYSYIIAGGDKALLTSQETPEDDPLLGALSLDKACVGKKHVLFIGISCGLSAPFVAGQLDFCLRNLEIFTPVLIGFNPIDMARSEPIQNCSFHFKDIAVRMNEMQKQQKAYVLNPAVGPEAISGSSRMKGGSATKIILEIILLASHQAAYNKQAVTQNTIRHSLDMFEKVHQITYSQTSELAALVQRAAISLRRKGHVYYLGWQTLGIIGIIDASECIPTFGAGFEDIRGFVSNGFSEMNNKEGDLSSLVGERLCIQPRIMNSSIYETECLYLRLAPLFSCILSLSLCLYLCLCLLLFFFSLFLPIIIHILCDFKGPQFIIDHKDFVDRILPNLKESDTVIFLFSENDDLNEVSELAKSVRQHTSNLHAITHELKGLSEAKRMRSLFMTVLIYKWPSSLFIHQPDLLKQCWELSTKWCLNAISTGAHVLIGKVYMNYMIDLRVTNSKLYRRAIHILQRFTGSTQSQCETALLRALYDVEELSDEMSSTDVTQHTLVANKRGSVVPIALVMLQSRRTIAETKSYLNAYSVIRDAVAACQRLL